MVYMETKHECTNHYKSPNTITITVYIRAIKPNTFTQTISKNHDTNPTMVPTILTMSLEWWITKFEHIIQYLLNLHVFLVFFWDEEANQARSS